MVKIKLRLRGRDLSGEIWSGILCKKPCLASHMVGWRPIWCKFCVAWGQLGFRAWLAHPQGPQGGVFTNPVAPAATFLAGVVCFSDKAMVQQNVEMEGVGPLWRDPERNSEQKAVPGVPYGGMATHLVQILCGLGSLGVPGPASTPLGSWPKTKGGVGDLSVTIVSADAK